MPTFIKKPIRVEAVQWSNKQPGLLPDWAKQHVTEGPVSAFLDTPNGRRHIEHGDWIVKDSTGSLASVPCESFDSEYAPAEDEKTAA